MMLRGDEPHRIQEGREAQPEQEGKGDHEFTTKCATGILLGGPNNTPETRIPISRNKDHHCDRPMPFKLQPGVFAELNGGEGGEHKNETQSGGTNHNAPESLIFEH